jgi:hypothetical protein
MPFHDDRHSHLACGVYNGGVWTHYQSSGDGLFRISSR